jgi:HD superfamily phosphodiesterase
MIETIYKLAEPFWQTRSGEIHMPQAFEFSKRLLEQYPKADAEIVLPAILLHDIGYARVPEETHHQGLAGAPKGWQPEVTRLHEIEGVKMAREMLTEKILEIIDGHDSRKKAVSLEDAIVKDADKLWRFRLEGVTICRGWMGMNATDFMAYVEAKITEWFLTDHGAELARETLSQTRTTLKENA